MNVKQIIEIMKNYPLTHKTVIMHGRKILSAICYRIMPLIATRIFVTYLRQVKYSTCDEFAATNTKYCFGAKVAYLVI